MILQDTLNEKIRDHMSNISEFERTKPKQTMSSILDLKVYCEEKIKNSLPVMTESDRVIVNEFQFILEKINDIKCKFESGK